MKLIWVALTLAYPGTAKQIHQYTRYFHEVRLMCYEFVQVANEDALDDLFSS